MEYRATTDSIQYPFVVAPDPDTENEWLVIFPDLEGCMGYADSIDNIGKAAKEALSDWMEVAEEFGDSVPSPSPSSPVKMPEWALTAFPARMPSLTADDIARQLGITSRRVRALAQSRGIGERFNRTVMFYEDDVERLRPGKPGRPAGV